jgi:hypothetical protein
MRRQGPRPGLSAKPQWNGPENLAPGVLEGEADTMTNSKRISTTLLFSSLCSLLVSTPGMAQTYVSVEGDATWQSRNEARIPGSTGTTFAITDFGKGPFPGFRIYVGHMWNRKHELRALYAPLDVEFSGQFSQPVDYQGETFAANTPTTARYKFNSYRLTYAYHFESQGAWRWALGFTGKVRDASIGLTQAGVSAERANVGFVPLLNAQAVYDFASDWSFRFDMDGLAARQGRAIDAALFIEHRLGSASETQPWAVFAGYRTIEGGADNKDVYNFAWLHKAVLGVRGGF